MCLGEIGRVVAVPPAGGVTVRIGERRSEVTTVFVDEPVRAGDWVLIHSGAVIARLADDEARAALALRSGGPS